MTTTGKVRILCVVGTRPEVIKMAPVILALRKTNWAETRVLVTAQHRGLLDQAMADFSLSADIDLDSMLEDQSLSELTARMLTMTDAAIANEQPDFVLGQGDTTTVLVTALCCFYRNIPFGHVEAGLRTCLRRIPFPEEMNRVFSDYLTTLHFAPTEAACKHLKNEGIQDESIFLTGNTVIDALLYQVKCNINESLSPKPGHRLILVTAHRRENFGRPIEEICGAIAALSEKHKNVEFLFPVHPNPNISRLVYSLLSGKPRIRLCAPLNYPNFVSAIKYSYLVITDSGGVQEEAPALSKPVLVTRTHTERPEAVNLGVAKLIGCNQDDIISEVTNLLDDVNLYQRMARGESPYGDGKAAGRIVAAIARFFNQCDTSPIPAEFSSKQEERNHPASLAP